MREINGNSPKNARIKIDYSKKKPKVTFAYPSEKHQVTGSMFAPILMMLGVMALPVIIILSIATKKIESDIINASIGIGIPIVLVLVAYLIYFPFKKKWIAIYPKYQAWKERKKISTMTKKDIQKRDGKYYCELPVFKNIILDYTATKDFSKYLELLEIREHNFKYHLEPGRIRSLLKQKKGRDKVKKKQLNEWMWYARFYFKQKPTIGQIKIIYK